MLTKEQLKSFFEERPSLSKAGICKEADISKGLLDMILRNDRSLSQETINRLLPVMQRYGYHQK